jgi:hypothetical protein
VQRQHYNHCQPNMKNIFSTIMHAAIYFLIVVNINAQVPNNGFESWAMDIDSNMNPVSWQTSNSYPEVSVAPYTPAYSGNYSMLVKVFNSSINIPGTAYIDFPFNLRPTEFTVCLKANIMPGDIAIVMFSSYIGDSAIAAPDSCTFKIDSTISQFQCLTLPVKHISSQIPDSANIMILAGDFLNGQLGTEIIVDEISFSLGVGINKTEVLLSAILGQNYPNPSSGIATVSLSLTKGSGVAINIYDMHGREIKTVDKRMMAKGEHIIQLPVDELSNGIYSYTVKGDDFILSKKMVVNK